MTNIGPIEEVVALVAPPVVSNLIFDRCNLLCHVLRCNLTIMYLLTLCIDAQYIFQPSDF